MDCSQLIQAFIEGMKQTGPLEYVAVLSGIISVWFSRNEKVLVYPTGLVNTLIYIYLSFQGGLLGEATVNLYYSIMSVYGWYWWSRKDGENHILLHITSSSRREWARQFLFFGFFYATIFLALTWLKKDFAPGAIPWADALASATAFTGMWLMTKKKVESWYWWIATNLASIPLYFVKQYVFTSVYYLVLLLMAISGLMAWKKAAVRQ